MPNISDRALIARINRRLAREGERLVRLHCTHPYADYGIKDGNDQLTAYGLDWAGVLRLAVEVGALRPDEAGMATAH